ncbi:hypothetical protein V3C99_014185, partial [Haemonchus contortus]
MLLSPDLSDVTFVVDGKTFAAHKMLLVARSKYFRALFLDGLKESSEGTVALKETSAFAFGVLLNLRYIYTGKLSLKKCNEEQVMDILRTAHMYCLVKLEKAVAGYLKTIVNCQNVCTIFNFSLLYSLDDLRKLCQAFTTQNTQQVLASQGFLLLSAGAVSQLLDSGDYNCGEILIFRAVRDWIKAHQEIQVNTEEMVKKCVCLPRIRLVDLLKEVRPSGLVREGTILDAIEEQ